MLGKDRLIEFGHKMLNNCEADQSEIMLTTTKSSLTRFANSYIHQNVFVINHNTTIRVVRGKKIGIASVSSLEESSIKKAIDTAIEQADFQKKNPDFKSLPMPKSYKPIDSFIQKTSDMEPEERAQIVKKVIAEADKHQGLKAFGAISTGAGELCVMNSLGVEAYQASTSSELSIVVMSDTGSGYAEEIHKDVDKLNIDNAAETATKKSLESQNPIEIEPGEYDVVLEPLAVADIFGAFVQMGFNALAVQEKRSYIEKQVHLVDEQKLLGENISFFDDAFHKDTIGMPFDFEGTPKQRVNLCENGVVKGIVYDTFTANKEGKESTGHALPAKYMGYGPMPFNLILKNGDASIEDIIASVDRGLLITRFHYLNPYLQPKIALMTGMTRDGTFLIENGKVTKPVKNLRFTESMLKAFSNVAKISKDQKLLGGWIGTLLVPALLIKNFKFTGTTAF